MTIKVPSRGAVCAGALKPDGAAFDNPVMGICTVEPENVPEATAGP
jgi:hypothetical protein